MGFPTISRSFGVRDDYIDASLTTLNSGSVTTDTFTSDGDIVTWNVTMTNPSNGDVAILYRPVVSGPDPSIWSNSIVRLNVTSWPNATNFQIRPWIAYTPSGATDTGQFSLVNSTNLNNFIPTNFPLTNGKQLANNTINQIGFEILCVNGGAGTFNFALQLDFIYVFKELLTLPSVRQPISLRKRRNIIEIPILQREGGIQQDLGSMSWDITVGGHLISTTAGVGSWTNTYTADQWWFILNGLILESGIITPDGNPRWQWFQSDQIQAKVLVTDYMPQQPMGRVQFWDYALQLKKFDILSETHLRDLGYEGIPGFGY
jgi:hypothetical protein